ncbi:MAG: tripartite tricarboxylate transporter substrate binding protein [Lautropia sp.]
MLAGAGTAASVCLSPARAQAAWPNKPVKVLLGFPAGGSIDSLTREIAHGLGNRLGQPFIVENRPGAASTIAMAATARAAPDGYTLCSVSSHLSATPKLYPNLGYDVDTSFTPIALEVIVPTLVVAPASLKVNTLQELVALAKSNPGRLSYASTGNGGVVHLSSERFKAAAGIDIVHVPYRNDVESQMGILRGDVAMQFAVPSTAIVHVRSGAMKALAWSGLQRGSLLPDLPTIAESGYPGFSAVAWYGLIGPANLPRPITERLAAEVGGIINAPDMLAKLRGQGLEPVTDSTPEKFGEFIRSEADKWAAVIVANKIKGD